MPTASDLVTDLPADFETFGQAVATSMADLLGGTTGQVLSKASNTDMDFTWVAADDTNAIQNAIVDAKGDLIAASAADTPARLAVGNNGETLVADSSTSTGLKWAKSANFVGCSLAQSSTFVVSNNTWTSILFDFELIDTNSFHSTTTNTTRISIPSDLLGTYLITANALIDPSATGYRQMRVQANGSETISQVGEISGVSSRYLSQNMSFIYKFTSAAYIELQVFQTSGANLGYYARATETPFTVTYLGA
jgi:hypothetical protein